MDVKNLLENDKSLDIKVATGIKNLKNEGKDSLKTGTTTLGVKCKDGVVLASESKSTLGFLVASQTAQKVYQIDDKIALTTAGGSGDTQSIVRMLKAEINIYKTMRENDLTVNGVSTLLANILQQTRFYPLLAMLIIGGHDKKGFHIYTMDPLGGHDEEDYTSTGSGSPIAYGVLEDGYKNNLTTKDGIKLAVRSINSAKKRDIFSGGELIQVAIIDENGTKFLSTKEIQDSLQ